MTPEQKEKLKQLLFDEIPKNGTTKGNKTLRDNLLKVAQTKVPDLTESLRDQDYWEIRNELVAEGKIDTAGGKGGSVYRLVDVQQSAQTSIIENSISEWEDEDENKKEKGLYEPFRRGVDAGWAPGNKLKIWIVEITAFAKLSGVWTRPDITVVAVHSHKFIPGKRLEAITFELKRQNEFDVKGVFEALAHSASVHKSYLAIHVLSEYDTNAQFTRLKEECSRLGVGLIVFSKPDDFDTWETIVEATYREPDPLKLNDFIRDCVTDNNKDTLLEALKGY